MKPPIAKRVEHRREHHGDVFIDPYEWLRDKSNHEVIDHLEAENAYTESVTADLESLRQKIFDEIKARTKETDLSVPTRRGDWWYYGRSFEGKQYGVQCRCPVTDPDDWTPPAVRREHRDSRRAGAARRERRGRGPRLLLPGRRHRQRGRKHPGLLGRRQGRRAVHVAVQGFTDRSSATTTRSSGSARAPPGPPTTAPSTTSPSTTRGARTPCGGTASEPACRPNGCITNPTNGSGSPSGAPAATSTSSSPRAARSPRSCVYGDAADPQAEFASVWPRREQRRVLGRARRRRRRGPVPHPAQRRCGELHPRRGAGQRPDWRCRTLIEHRDDVRLDSVDAFDGHLVVSYRSDALPRIQLWPIEGAEYGQAEDITLRLRTDVGRAVGQPELECAQAADRRDVVRHPGADLRPRPGHRRADAAARTTGAR